MFFKPVLEGEKNQSTRMNRKIDHVPKQGVRCFEWFALKGVNFFWFDRHTNLFKHTQSKHVCCKSDDFRDVVSIQICYGDFYSCLFCCLRSEERFFEFSCFVIDANFRNASDT